MPPSFRPPSGPAHAPRPAAPRPAVAWAALAVVLALSAAGCGRRTQDAADVPHTPIPKTPARFSLKAADGKLRYEGVVGDDAERVAVINAIETTNPGAATGRVNLDGNTAPAPWAVAGLGPLAASVRRTGGSLELQGRQIELGGQLDQEDRATLLRAARKAYPGFALTGGFQGVDLAQALPEEGDLAGLLAFLNRSPLVFQTGTGMLAPVSVEALARAARGIRAAGDVGRLELRIFPETGGDAIGNRELARQRAQAIATQLALRGVAPARLSVRIMPADAARPGAVQFATAAADAPPVDLDPEAGPPGKPGDEPKADGGGMGATTPVTGDDAAPAPSAPQPMMQGGRGD